MQLKVPIFKTLRGSIFYHYPKVVLLSPLKRKKSIIRNKRRYWGCEKEREDKDRVDPILSYILSGDFVSQNLGFLEGFWGEKVVMNAKARGKDAKFPEILGTQRFTANPYKRYKKNQINRG